MPSTEQIIEDAETAIKISDGVDRLKARIAELEAALDEILGASFEISKQTIGVPIGAWENAMRFLRPRQT
jgi:hypothetical protein